jgi:hypothetical protein
MTHDENDLKLHISNGLPIDVDPMAVISQFTLKDDNYGRSKLCYHVFEKQKDGANM